MNPHPRNRHDDGCSHRYVQFRMEVGGKPDQRETTSNASGGFGFTDAIFEPQLKKKERPLLRSRSNSQTKSYSIRKPPAITPYSYLRRKSNKAAAPRPANTKVAGSGASATMRLSTVA